MGVVLAVLGVVQFESADGAGHECLHIGVVASVGNAVHLIGDAQLACLVVQLFHEDEEVLLERLLLLFQLIAPCLAVVFSHAHATLASAPVQQRNAHAHFHTLVFVQWRIGTTPAAVLPRIAHAGIDVHAAAVAPCRSHVVVGFQTVAFQSVCQRVVLDSLLKGQRKAHVADSRQPGHLGVDIDAVAHVEECGQPETRVVGCSLVVRQ